MPRLKPGKPAKFSLNGLFLPDLALVYQLDGQSVSGMASVAGLTSTLKTLASIGQVPEVAAGGWDHTETISRRFTRALVKFDDLGGSPAQVELMSQMRAAIAGDQQARDRFDAMGTWEMALTIYTPDTWWHVCAEYCAEVERDSKAAVAKLRERDFAAVAAEIEGNERLRRYFTDATIALMRSAQTDAQALVARGFGLCEFLLSQLARNALQLSHWRGKSILEDLRGLLDTDQNGLIRPGRQVFAALKGALGAKSIVDMLRRTADVAKAEDAALPDESTLKRWSCGKSFPSQQMIEALLSPYTRESAKWTLNASEAKRIMGIYYVARRIDTLLDLMGLMGFARKNDPERAKLVPTYLYGNTVEEWLTIGYDKWLAHWSEPAQMSECLDR